MAGGGFVRRKANVPDAHVEERLEVLEGAVLVFIDDDRILINGLGLHIEGERADGRNADQKIRPLDFALQAFGHGERRLLHI